MVEGAKFKVNSQGVASVRLNEKTSLPVKAENSAIITGDPWHFCIKLNSPYCP
jgi:hypothetical protein